MKAAPLPNDEQERMQALRSYEILDSEAEPDFDGIVELASKICKTPISLITLVDEHRQWFKARVGLPVSETSRDVAFCAHAILDEKILVVPDALKDKRFHDNPLVTGNPKIRFYAGIPLTSNGHKLGTLCVIDKKPRKLSKTQLKDFVFLGRQVVNLLELRLRNLELKGKLTQQTIVRLEMEGRNTLIMNSALDAIVGMSSSGAITFWNPVAEKIFGWSESEIMGKPMTDTIIPEQYRQLHRNGLAHYQKTGEGPVLNKVIEITALNKAGTEFPVELTIVPIKQESNNFFCAFIRDISERKKAENALRESSENLERSEEQAKLGSWSVDLATQKRQWSKQMFGIFGLGPAGGVPEFEDVLPRYHPEDRQRIREWFSKALRGETPEPGVLRTNPELLPLRYLQPIFHIVKDEQGKPVRFEGTLQDVTERIMAEASLKETTESLEHAEELAMLGSWYVDVPSGKWHWSKQMFRFFGLDPAGAMPDLTENLKLYHPDDRELIKDGFEKMLRGEQLDAHAVRTNPELLPLRYLLPAWKFVTDENGRPLRLEGTLQDVTERILAEEAIKATELRYRNLIEQASDAIFVLNDKQQYIDVNLSGCKLLGYTKEEFLKLSIRDIIFEEDFEKDPPRFQDLREGKEVRHERRFRRKDGSAVEVELSGKMMENKGFLIFVRDITERKNAERALRLAEENYRSIFENALIGIYQSTPEGKFIMANPAMAKMFGYDSPEDLVNSITNIGSQIYADKEERHRLKTLLKEHGQAMGFEFRVLKKDGKVIWVRDNLRAVYKSDGRVKYYEGSLKDITEQKVAEMQLRKEKELSDSIINSLPGVLYLFDSTGKYIRWNKNFETVTGYSGQEIANMHPLQLFDEDEKELLTERITGVFNAGFGEVEAHFLLKDKRKIPYYFNGWRIVYEGKTCLIGMGIDISERKKAETKLKDSENKLRAFFRSTPDSSVLLGRNFEILAFNDAANLLSVNASGQSIQEGENWLQYIFPEVRHIIKEFVEKAFKGETSQGEFPIINNKTGKGVWWMAVFMPAYDDEGNIFAVVANSTNIDKIKRAELQLKKQFEELQKTNHELDRFVYSASHDLRSPLSSILGLINVAEMENLSEVSVKYLTMIKANVTRLDAFIKDILDYSRNSRTEISAEKLDILELFNIVQNNLEHLPGARRIRTEVKVNGTHELFSDRTRLEILLSNLFANAIKYQDYNKDVSFVNITITVMADNVQITFSDNGIGIGEQHHDRIFDMFYRASENSKGSGLGLYIVKETVEKLKGTIRVKSEFGLSTEFSIAIPNSNHASDANIKRK